MSKQLIGSTETLLNEYSALAEYWDEEAGDTHELLGTRELLDGRRLGPHEKARMDATDRRIIALSEARQGNGWDVAMLRKTADLIRRSAAQKQAA
jgi:hypothetical protein